MNIFYREKLLKNFKNKAYCIQWQWDKPSPFLSFSNHFNIEKDSGFSFYINWFGLFDVDIHWKIKEDHAGIGISFGLLGFMCENIVYDTRHWDYEKECWEEGSPESVPE